MDLTKCARVTIIVAKRVGTLEQCSQKLFELAEIFKKIIKNYKYIYNIFIYIMYNEERFLDEGKISKISPYSKYFLLY